MRTSSHEEHVSPQTADAGPMTCKRPTYKNLAQVHDAWRSRFTLKGKEGPKLIPRRCPHCELFHLELDK